METPLPVLLHFAASFSSTGRIPSFGGLQHQEHTLMRTESVTNNTEKGTDSTNNESGEKDEVNARQDRSVGTACTAKITNNGADTAIATPPPHLRYYMHLLPTPPAAASPSPELKLQQLLRRLDNHLPPHHKSCENSLHPPPHLPSAIFHYPDPKPHIKDQHGNYIQLAQSSANFSKETHARSSDILIAQTLGASWNCSSSVQHATGSACGHIIEVKAIFSD